MMTIDNFMQKPPETARFTSTAPPQKRTVPCLESYKPRATCHQPNPTYIKPVENPAQQPSIMATEESWERTKRPQAVVRLAAQGETSDRRWLAMHRLWIPGCVALLLGCETKTETGYVPRKLGDSEIVQRGY